MVKEVHVLHADFGEVVLSLDAHRGDLNPLAVLPVRTGCRNLAEVDLGVEVRGERIAVVAAVAVKDVDVVYLVKVML